MSTTMSVVKSFIKYLRSMRFQVISITILVTLALSLVACTRTEPEQELSIAAAASLTTPFTKIGELFTSETGIEVTLSFASTGHLAQQIRYGAPYDIFAAADALHVDDLIDEGFLLPSSRTQFAQGRLVMIYQPEDFVNTPDPTDILRGDIQKLVIANPEHAPYGVAAKQFLTNIGLWDSLQESLIFSETVRQATQVVRSGNASVGIVAQSTVSNIDVRVEPIDPELYDPILHVAAITVNSRLQNQAALFLEYLQSPTGREILAAHGLDPVRAR